MKKKSISHVVLLKQKVKERILGKAKGPSTTPCASSDTSDSDVPPTQKVVVCQRSGPYVPIQQPPLTQEKLNEFYNALMTDKEFISKTNFTIPPYTPPTIEDATAGLTPEALPEAKRLEMYQNATYEHVPVQPTQSLVDKLIAQESERELKRQQRRTKLMELLPPQPWPEGMGVNYQAPPFKSPYDDPAIKKSMGNAWKGLCGTIEDSTAINQQAKAVISKVPTAKPDPELARLEKSQLKGKKKGGEA